MSLSPHAHTPVSDFDPAEYTDNAVRQAYRMLCKEIADGNEAIRLVARSCRRSVEDIQRIVHAPPRPKPTRQSGRELAAVVRTKLTAAPSPGAMMALKQLASRDPEFNATIIVAVHLKNDLPAGFETALQADGFIQIPHYEEQNALQGPLLQYIATILEYRPEHLFCSAKNVLIEGAEAKVGRVSAPGMLLDDTDFEPHVKALREAIDGLRIKLPLHYICLPPLDLTKLSLKSRTMRLEKNASSGDTSTAVEVISGPWLRARSRDNVFIAWVQRTWPAGAPLDEVVERIEFADWLVALMAYTRYRARFPQGKRMLVKVACLCARRAQTWCEDVLGREAIEAAEAWLREPSKEHQERAGKVAERTKEASSIGINLPPAGMGVYTQQAVRESAVRAAMAAHAHDPDVVSNCAARASASAVMAASFANAHTGDESPGKSDSWLKMIGAAAAPGETAENRWLCNEIRRLIKADSA